MNEMAGDFVSSINANCSTWGTPKVDDARQIITHSALDDDAADQAHISEQHSAQVKYGLKRACTGHFGRYASYDVYTGVENPQDKTIMDKLIKRSHGENPDSKQKAFQMGPDQLVIANL
jgi:hypothetical protein